MVSLLQFFALAQFFIICVPILARILNRCELVHEMLKLGVPPDELATWACIAKYESKFNTSAIGRLNGNWSNDWGIFQISDRYWCVSSPTRRSDNRCNVQCQRLLGNRLDESVRCAQLVKRRQGWMAWAVYRGCSRKLQNVDDCY